MATTAVVAGLTDEAVARTGLHRETPFVVGANDGALATLGVGALRPGVVACTVGTSGAVRAVVPRPTVHAEGRLFCTPLTADRWVLGGAVNNGGIVLRWIRDVLLPDVAATARSQGSDPYAALTALAEGAPAGAGGLLVLPYLTGERAPSGDAPPRGVLFGLRHDHGRAHLVRAALEGVVYELHRALRMLEAASGNATEVRVTGGFTASPLWRQVMSDIFGRPIRVPVRAEGSVFGAALLGMHALGWLGSLDEVGEIVAIDGEHRPDAAAAAVHARLQPLFAQLAVTLAPAFAALDELATHLPGNPAPHRREGDALPPQDPEPSGGTGHSGEAGG